MRSRDQKLRRYRRELARALRTASFAADVAGRAWRRLRELETAATEAAAEFSGDQAKALLTVTPKAALDAINEATDGLWRAQGRIEELAALAGVEPRR